MTFTNVLENLSRQWVSTVFNDAEGVWNWGNQIESKQPLFAYNSMGCSLLVNSPWIMCLCNMLTITRVMQDIVGQVWESWMCFSHQVSDVEVCGSTLLAQVYLGPTHTVMSVQLFSPSFLVWFVALCLCLHVCYIALLDLWYQYDIEKCNISYTVFACTRFMVWGDRLICPAAIVVSFVFVQSCTEFPPNPSLLNMPLVKTTT